MNEEANKRTFSEEELLEWALDESVRTPERERFLAANPAAREQLLEIEESLAAMRDVFLESSETPAGFVDDVLSETTREDISWRGDLRLVRGFFSDRLRSSWILRVVAASLLIHLVALPVLAYVIITQERKPLYFRFEPPRESMPETPVEPERPVEFPALENLPEDDEDL